MVRKYTIFWRDMHTILRLLLKLLALLLLLRQLLSALR